MRWVAVVGQVATIAIVYSWLDVDLPLPAMASVIAFLVGLNVLTLIRLRHTRDVGNVELFVELLLDVAALTVQLCLSGGASNPFVSLYLLQVIIGAVLLEDWSTWALLLVTSACFIGLTVVYRPLAILGQRGADDELFSLHTRGMFICFVLAASLLVFFVTRINRNLRARDLRLAELRQQSAEEHHIVRMGLLASGAAHELGTPLSTLSVIVNDWRRVPALAGDPEILHDLDEMKTQLNRCKSIVTGILLSSGEARGEGTVRTTVRAFIDELVADWRALRNPALLDYVNRFSPDEAIVSDLALKQVIFNVFDNALEASPAWVGVMVERQGGRLIITVNDRGPGFPADIVEHVGKPYRSTKGRPGSGLGLFLVVNVVRKLGGTVAAANAPSRGARVTLTFPLAALSQEAEHG
ncbi:ATP-binding protein [Chelatococcus reniformis]|nr:ATP-binding protein [Chelatococcus reniformis]